MSNMYEDPIYDEVGTSYDSNIPSEGGWKRVVGLDGCGRVVGGCGGGMGVGWEIGGYGGRGVGALRLRIRAMECPIYAERTRKALWMELLYLMNIKGAIASLRLLCPISATKAVVVRAIGRRNDSPLVNKFEYYG
ncbi:hypothetical protein Tco_0963602 [Tanacetum coccineum]